MRSVTFYAPTRSAPSVAAAMFLPVVLLLASSCLPVALEARLQPAWLGSPLQADAPADRPPTGGDSVGLEMVASCRAVCGSRFLQMPATDGQCLDERQCVKCWRLCDLLYTAELKWRLTCEMDDCFDGCKTACDYDFSKQSVPPSADMWKFSVDPVLTVVDDTTLHVAWSPLEYQQLPSSTPPPGGVPIVYTLLFMDSTNPRWRHVTSTMNLKAIVEGPHASLPGLRFQLLASSSEGTLGRVFVPYTAARRRFTPPTATSTTTATSQGSRVVMTSPEVEVKVTVDGSLEAVVTWGQRFTETGVRYTVTWGRHSCNVDIRAPFCPLREDELTATIKAKDREEMRVVLTQLTFNSEYRLAVTLEGRVHRSAFSTPACRQVDATFMRCVQPDTTATPTVKTTTPATTTTSTAPSTVSSTRAQMTSPASHQSTRGHRNASQLSSTVQPVQAKLESTVNWLSANWLVLAVATGTSLATVLIFTLCLHLYRCVSDHNKGSYLSRDLTYVSVPTPSSSHALLHHLHGPEALSQRLLAQRPPPAAHLYVTTTSDLHDVTSDLQSHSLRPDVPDIAVTLCSDDDDDDHHHRPTRTSTPCSATWPGTRNALCLTVPHGMPSVHSSRSTDDLQQQRHLPGSARRQLHFSFSRELPGATCRELPASHSPDLLTTSFPADTSSTSYNQFCFIEDVSSDVEC